MKIRVPEDLVKMLAEKRYKWRIAREFPGDADGDWYSEDYYDDYTQTEYITDDDHELIKLLEEAYKNYVERAFNGSY